MQYNVNINQKAIIDAKLDLDFEDAAIMAFIYSFSHSSAIDKMVSNNKEYYWFAYKKVLAELPLLKISKDRVYRKFKNMAELGLLEAHPDNKTLGRSYYAITQKMVALYHGNDSPPSVKTTDPYGENDVPPTVKTTDNHSTIYQDTISDNTPPLSPVGGEQFEESTDFSKEKKQNTIPLPGPGPGEAQLDLMARQATFKEEVYQVGGLTYTSEMLNRFIQTYSQPNDAKKPKMRWEVEKKKKGWDTKDRLALWAKRNLDGIQCFLTVDDQKTIKDKRAEFAKSIEAFKDRYTRDMLLEFYRYWSLPEQCHNPKRLRWELQGFWDLGTKLAEWESRDSKRTKQFSHQQR